jgi:hypothetical protein
MLKKNYKKNKVYTEGLMSDRVGIIKFMKNLELPLQIRDCCFNEYIKKKFKSYISELERVVDNRENSQYKDLYISIRKELKTIKKVCEKIIYVLKLYDDGNIKKAYAEFYDLMREINKNVYTRKINLDSRQYLTVKYYRIRSVESDLNYRSQEIFHIPFNKREDIKPYRFSISGFPCLYLSSTEKLCWFECNMPNSFIISKFVVKDGIDKEYINFAFKPKDFASSLKSLKRKDPKKDIFNDAKKFLITYPLMISCLTKVKNKNAVFKHEYLIPQFLLQYIRNTDEYCGIGYISAAGKGDSDIERAFNLVLPTRKIEPNGFCSELKSYFKVSKPIYKNLKENLRDFEDTIDLIKVNFYKLNQHIVEENDKNLNGLLLLLDLIDCFIKNLNSIKYSNCSDADLIYNNIQINVKSYRYTLKSIAKVDKLSNNLKSILMQVESLMFKIYRLDYLLFTDDIKDIECKKLYIKM